MIRAISWMAVLMTSASFAATFAAVPSVDIRDAWKGASSEWAKAASTGAGFSFKYAGKTVGPEFPDAWQRTTAHDAKTGVTSTVLTHGSGLVVTRQTRVFTEFGAVEYQLRFKNTANKALAPISALQSLNVSFDGALARDSCVISSGGGLAEAVLPPKTFALRKQCLHPSASGSADVELTTEGGRSSNRDLPFFFIQNDALREGLFVAFGWSGQWDLVAQGSARALTLRGRIPNIDIALEPGEEIQGPTVLVGLYRGELADGSNRLRRLIREHYTPKLAGADVMPMTVYDTFFGLQDRFDEPILRQVADGAAAIGQEYFLLDAGWFKGKQWFNSVGNWRTVEPSRLPNGLKPTADYIRSKGMRFGLWFEPERVAEGSELAREHPEWILWNHGTTPTPWLGHVPWIRDVYDEGSMQYHPKEKFGLLDYGRPEVQRWVREMMDRHIRENGVKYIRYDFNIDPLPFWDANDKPDRRGLLQLRHIQGMYAVIDWLRERHPDLVLEGCASGGRRIDLETARKFHVYWISDYTVDPSIVRFHLHGLNYFLPGNYSYVAYILQPSDPGFRLDDYGFQSFFGGALGTGGHVELWPAAMQEKARLHTETHKKIRRYLVEDYYPLSAQPGDLTSWSGWQFQDPKDHSGFIQTFRTKTTDATHRFVLHQLESQARYRFTDAYGTESFEMTGAAAMMQGIEVTQEPMSSRVLTYRKVLQ